MVSLSRTTLLFTLSSVIFVDISYGFILGASICGGFAWLIWRPMKQVGYFFSSPGYWHHLLRNKDKYPCCGKYVHKATDDDIKQGKYIFVDLFSTAHHHAILRIEDGDQPEDRRTSVTTYKVDPDIARVSPKFLTIGCVNFWIRSLQCDLGYYDRTIKTYWDENNKFCVLIESFDSTGLLIKKRIYRDRDKFWWKDRIVDEKVSKLSLLTAKGLSIFSRVPKEKLKLFSDSSPRCVRGGRFNGGITYYNYPKDGNVDKIDGIEFGTTSVNIKDKVKEVCIWHFYKMEKNEKKTSLVVIYERADKKEYYTYYKCVDPSKGQFEIVDSLVQASDHIKLSKNDNSVQRNITTIEWLYNLQTRLDDHAQKMTIHAYPESNHFTIRPSAVNNPTGINSVKIKDSEETLLPCKSELFTHFTLQGIQKKSKRFSVVSFNNTDVSFQSMKFRLNQQETRNYYPYDVHTIASLSSRVPLYYLGSSVFASKIIGDKYKVTLDRDDDIVLMTKMNEFTTFYGSNLTVYNTLSDITWENLSVQVGEKINSQLLHCDVNGSEFIVLLQSQQKPVVYQKENGKLAKKNENQHNTLFKGAHITFLSDENQIHKWQEVTLDLADRIIPDNVEVLLPSTDCVIYKTSYGKRINKILWKGSILDIPNGWPQVSRLTCGDYSFVLVDLVIESEIVRRLYELDGGVDKLRLLSDATIEKNIDNLDIIKKKVEKSLIDLIPATLGVNINFDDPRLHLTTNPFDAQTIMYSDPHSKRSVGYLNIRGQSFNLEPKHLWRQVFRTETQKNVATSYRTFTLTNSGVREDCFSDKMTTSEVKFDELTEALPNNTVQLLVDSLAVSSDIDRTESRLGQKLLVTYKLNGTDKVLNPIVFGMHEIKLLKDPRNVNVTTSYNEEKLRQVTIEFTLQAGKETLNFVQKSHNSEVYNLKTGNKDAYIDLNTASSLDKETHDYGSIDFNEPKYPNNIRYLTLGKELVYFTGVTRTEKFSLKAGDHNHTIDGKGIKYHIWMKYPYDNVNIAKMLVTYTNKDKFVEHIYDLNTAEEAKKLKRPDRKFNWGVLTHKEAIVVHQNLLRMVNHKEDLLPVDLSLPLKEGDNTIFKLEISDEEHVYTAPAHRNYIINDVKYKNAVIKGTEKQIVKYVYHSKKNNEDIILIVTKTISRLLKNAYLFGENGHFEEIDINNINEAHSVLAKFKTKK